ncbi:hypothetical protein SLA2020_251360 [Shorea laevis]
MKIITWNSRGVKHGPFRRECKELLKTYKPDVICILETKVNSESNALNFMMHYGFDKQHHVLSQGRAGGLWLFWKSSSIQLTVLTTTPQAIHCSISHQCNAVVATFAYVQPHHDLKEAFWSQIVSWAQAINVEWIIMGDFNDFASAEEANPCAQHGSHRAQRFRDRMATCGIHSKEALGCKYTWIRKMNGRVSLRERLDRALFNLKALEALPSSKLINLPRLCSDHHPIMLCIDAAPSLHNASKPVRFEATSLTNENFSSIFNVAWNEHHSSLPMAIQSVWETCLKWSKESFGDIFRRKRNLRARLTGIQNSPYYPYSNFLHNLELDLLAEYHKILHAEEVFWCQKSRREWIASGDRNTSFYHASTIIRRSKNKISALMINDTWVTDDPVLKTHVRDFFVELFAKKQTTYSRADYREFQPQLTEEEGASLLGPVSPNEIRKALFSMKSLKSPGPDGIQPIFYQKH